MKLFLLFFSSILITGNVYAEKIDPQKITNQLHQLKDIATKCHQTFAGEMIVYKMKRNFEGAAAVSNLHSNIYSNTRQCKDDGKAKIKSAASVFINDMNKIKSESIAKDYIIQAIATIEATTNSDIFDAEESKLKTILERIELEMSLK